MRSNPLNNDRTPRYGGVLLATTVSILVLGSAGVAAHVWNEARRVASVASAVEAAGFGRPEVEPIKGPECWRAREGYRWRTATARGWACAGPRDEVSIHEGRFDGRWP